MKIFKRGFTLAEVLLCLAVIGIVMAMGMKVTRNVTERAYNKYWAVGYENLYDVLRDMNTQQGNNANDYWNNLTQSPNAFITELRTYFSPSKTASIIDFEFKKVFASRECENFDCDINEPECLAKVYEEMRNCQGCHPDNKNEVEKHSGFCCKNNRDYFSGNKSECCNVWGNELGEFSELCVEDLVGCENEEYARNNPEHCGGPLPVPSLFDDNVPIKLPPLDSNGEYIWASTNNGIRYSVVGYNYSDIDPNRPHCIIMMSVPQPAAGNTTFGVTFFYFEPSRFTVGRYLALIPINSADVRALHNLSNDPGNNIIQRYGFNNPQIINLQDSPLLGFTTGREDPPRVRNYHDAYCNRTVEGGHDDNSFEKSNNGEHYIVQCNPVLPNAPSGQLNWYKR